MKYFSLICVAVLIFAGISYPQQQDTVFICGTDPEQFQGEDLIGELINTTWTLKILLVEFSDIKHRNPNTHGLPAYTFDDWHNLLVSEGS